jgi:CheY-like chemotaxis protein
MTDGNVKTAFGTTVRSKRCEKGLSQEELADRAGLHRTYVSDVERGARNPSLQSIEKLAVALEMSVSALFQPMSKDAPISDEHVEILLVEDIRQDVELTLHAFRKAQFSNVVHVVEDGMQALDFIFATGKFDRRRNQPLPGVVLLDLNLPKIDGLEVLRRLKDDPRTRHVPVIVLTASSEDQHIATCRQLGAASYIVKPVGFQNFSEVTPLLHLDWALVKPRESNGS